MFLRGRVFRLPRGIVDRLHLHRRIADQILLDILRFIAVAVRAPRKNAKAVEIVGPYAIANGRPEPGVFLLIAILHLAQRKIRHDAVALGILRHFVGDRHSQAAREHPAGLPVGRPHQAPIVGCHGRRGGCGRSGGLRGSSVFESSSQLAGGGGGAGMGGGGICAAFPDFFVAFAFFAGGGTRGFRGRSVRGRRRWVSTSTLSFSLRVRKLGAPAAGWICTRTSASVVAVPCEGMDGGALRQGLQCRHVVGAQQLALFDPTLGAIGSAHLYEQTMLVDNFQAVAVLYRGHRRGLDGKVAAQV
jgi:hypothetical protein